MAGEFSLDDIKKRIGDILLEPEIRFCGLIDPKGELVAGGFDSSIVPMLNDKQRRQLYQELAHRVANRQGFDADLGRVKYSASRRENAVMLSFPFGKHIVLVMANPGINIDRFAWDVLNKLGRSWSDFDSL
ncbi:DUF6659 family protein [Nitrosopumilus sp.]|uniref:DUF6659 family protein n=1 Tax=Nitrosopumilus sp. TaxID=2024843 RepID=UPI003D0D47A6